MTLLINISLSNMVSQLTNKIKNVSPLQFILPVLAPLLITWYVFVSLYAHNISGITLEYFWPPFLLATILTLGLFIILVGVCSSLTRGSIAASILLITFFAFGHLAAILGVEDYHNRAYAIIIALYAVLVVGAIWYFRRGAPFSQSIVKYLAMITTISIIIALFSIIPVEIERYQSSSKSILVTNDLPPSLASTSNNLVKPDIYYLIFDKYAGVHTLADYYNFDNQPFLNQLRQREFYVAEDSYANYPKTTFSLSSTLNYDYLQELIDPDDPAISDASSAAPLLSNNRVAKTLKQLGYTYYHAGNWYELTDTMDVADVNIQPSSSDFPRYDSFTDLVLETTYYPAISKLISTNSQPASSKVRHRLWAEFQHRQIKQVIHQNSPKFVVLHMLLPHDPYVYDANCKPLNQPLDRWDATKQIYTDQLQCTNKIIIEMVDAIQAQSNNKAIIVVQADEGPEAMVNKMPHHWQFIDASTEDIKERSNILNAYYFPDQNYNQLYQSITPINTFRTIFRQYFNLNLPNLEDKTYVFPDKDHLFDFIDVTDQLR